MSSNNASKKVEGIIDDLIARKRVDSGLVESKPERAAKRTSAFGGGEKRISHSPEPRVARLGVDYVIRPWKNRQEWERDGRIWERRNGRVVPIPPDDRLTEDGLPVAATRPSSGIPSKDAWSYDKGKVQDVMVKRRPPVGPEDVDWQKAETVPIARGTYFQQFLHSLGLPILYPDYDDKDTYHRLRLLFFKRKETTFRR